VRSAVWLTLKLFRLEIGTAEPLAAADESTYSRPFRPVMGAATMALLV
jgi:hypothetical protein